MNCKECGHQNEEICNTCPDMDKYVRPTGAIPDFSIKMKVKEVKWLPPGVKAITLWPFGIFYKGDPLIGIWLNHEKIHWEQQRELPVIFYIWYFVEWFIKLFIHGAGSYYNISFEREAFDKQWGECYLQARSRFAFIKYIWRK